MLKISRKFVFSIKRLAKKDKTYLLFNYRNNIIKILKKQDIEDRIISLLAGAIHFDNEAIDFSKVETAAREYFRKTYYEEFLFLSNLVKLKG